MYINKYFISGMVILCINALSFIIMGIDKSKAIKKKRRISEKALLLLALLYGAFGMWVGIIVFSHKKNKSKFNLVPVLMIMHLLSIYYLLVRY